MPSNYVSANTQKRLDFSLPKMKQNQDNLLWIVFNALGLEQILNYSIVGKWRLDGHKALLTRDELLKEIAPKLAENSIVDAYIPWLANQINKSNDVVKRAGGGSSYLYDQIVKGFRSICIWAKETKTDLNKLSLEEALEQSKGYVPNAARKGKEDSDANPVVYRFADGHKVVQLKTDEALKREGDIMKHCVGEYCLAVQQGESIIYSLRTPDNKPLVTMEYDPVKKAFEQMYGFENEEPEPETEPLILEFLKKMYPKEVKFFLKLGGSIEDLNLGDLKSVGEASLAALASNKKTPAAILEELITVASGLVENYDKIVRFEVARNPSTPVHVMEQLANDKGTSTKWGIHASLASNVNAPAALLDKLSRDMNWTTRQNVAQNLNTTTATLERLSRDRDEEVRLAVVRHPQTSMSTLDQMLGDEHKRVATEAKNIRLKRKLAEYSKARMSASHKLDIAKSLRAAADALESEHSL